MPKAARYFQKGCQYHLTHRCHNRSFLLRFAKDRDVYREMLRQRVRAYQTPLLGYCITSNHVHLLVTAVTETRISELMDSLEGDFAQYYNLRKQRSGAFWGARFHAVAIEEGEHLWNCLNYIDLNMVRAGVVSHPSDWRWCSYNEIMATRKRYRLMDLDQIPMAFGRPGDMARFRDSYRLSIDQRIHEERSAREGMWTETLAVGGETYVSEIAGSIRNRWKMDTLQTDDMESGAWILKEEPATYS